MKIQNWYRWIVLLLVGWSLTWAGPVSAKQKTWKGKTAAQLIKKMDRILQGRSSKTTLEMKIVTPRWKRTLRMKAWTKGLKFSFVRILSPQRERGTASLKRGKKMWNYLPRAHMVIKIPPSMMMSSWMGSDFTNDDLVKSSNVSRDYNSSITKIVKKKGQKLLVIELKPKPAAPVVWGKILVWLRAKDNLPVKQVFFDEKGKKVRIMSFHDFKKMDDRVIPAVMRMKPLNKPGHMTEMRYLKMKFNTVISSRVFRRSHLKKRNW